MSALYCGRRCLRLSLGVVLLLGATHAARGGSIPYANIGHYNAVTASFTAQSTGDVVAYIIGGWSAGYENQMGLLANGVLTSAGYGLDNHHSSRGQSFDLGHVKAGDSLVFVLHNLTLGKNAFSDASMNVSYDASNDTLGHNHIYTTAYAGSGGVPAGTYVGFEDLSFPNSDFNYNDESFVFTNVATVNPGISLTTPEPVTLISVMAALAGTAGWIVFRKRRTPSAIV